MIETGFFYLNILISWKKFKNLFSLEIFEVYFERLFFTQEIFITVSHLQPFFVTVFAVK